MELDRAFKELTREDRTRLREIAKRLTFNTGDIIVQEGSHVDQLLVVAAGVVRVTREFADDPSVEFTGPLGPGDIIGEMSLLDGVGASASLVADGDVDMLSIARKDLDRLLETDSGLASRFYLALFLTLCRRLRATNLRIMPTS